MSIKQFAEDHPYFIKISQLGLENIICMQTSFMASQAFYGNNELEEDIIYRIVADIAHGFWENKSWVFMMTLVFSLVLKRWIFILISFINSSLMEYYRVHFITIF